MNIATLIRQTEGKTLEFKRDLSSSKNPLKALIEQWGSGIRRILREAEKPGLPDLQMEEIGMRVRVTVSLAEQINIQSPSPEVEAQVGRKSKKEETPKSPGKREDSWR